MWLQRAGRMLWILKFVCLCARLFGFSVEMWCPRAILDRGPPRLTNRESREELKNLPTVVVMGPVPTSLRGARFLSLVSDRCLPIVCLMWMRLMWKVPLVTLLIECMWWPLRRLTLLIEFPLPWTLTSMCSMLRTLLPSSMLVFLTL